MAFYHRGVVYGYNRLPLIGHNGLPEFYKDTPESKYLDKTIYCTT